MTQTDPAEIFRLEAQDVLEQLEQTLLDLGETLDDHDLIDSAFRALHTIKGSGAMFGFTEVASFVHEFETAFDRVRKGDAAPSNDLVSVSLDAKDHIALLIAEPAVHAAAGEPILDRLRAIVGADASKTQPSEHEFVAADILPNNSIDTSEGWNVRFSLPEDGLSLGANPVLLLQELRDLGSCTVRASSKSIPNLEKLDPEICYLSWDVTLLGDCTQEAIEEVFMFVRDGMDLEIRPLPPRAEEVVDNIDDIPSEVVEEKVEPGNSKSDSQSGPSRGSSSLRVAAERLDELLDHVGELVIAQARLSQISYDSRDSSLMGVTEEIERLSAGLRDITMGIRMIPIGTLFNRFRRLVHDLSSDLGKNVEFATLP